uniref:Uncharacterized protein n=1 Tax=Euplotes harpa TaxID=151035 RepID=A0A7S3JJJ6_9SPIT
MLFGRPLFTAEEANYSIEGVQELWDTTELYYKCHSGSKRRISYEAMQFLQYSLQTNPQKRLFADELYGLDFIQNAYNEIEFNIPPQDKTCELYLTKHMNLHENTEESIDFD